MPFVSTTTNGFRYAVGADSQRFLFDHSGRSGNEALPFNVVANWFWLRNSAGSQPRLHLSERGERAIEPRRSW